MNATNKPHLIIYDLDGTLIDSAPDLHISLNLALETIPRASVTLAQVHTWIGNGSLKLVARALDYLRQDLEQDSQLLADTHQRFLWHYQHNLNSASRLYDGTKDLLSYIFQQGIPQGICTNKPQQFVPAIIRKLEIADYIKAIVGGNSLPERKPHPLPLEYLCRRFSCQPKNALMIGDSTSDIHSAQQAGIPCYLLEQGYAQGVNLHELGAERVFKNTQQLLDSLKHFKGITS